MRNKIGWFRHDQNWIKSKIVTDVNRELNEWRAAIIRLSDLITQS